MEEKFIFFLVHIGWNKVTIKLKKKEEIYRSPSEIPKEHINKE
jgi:hypothetical protein